MWASSSSMGVPAGGPRGLPGKVESLGFLEPSAGMVAGAGGMPSPLLRVWIARTESEYSVTIDGVPGLLLLRMLEGVENRGENRWDSSSCQGQVNRGGNEHIYTGGARRQPAPTVQPGIKNITAVCVSIGRVPQDTA